MFKHTKLHKDKYLLASKMRNRQAFTLVEIIVVMTMISVIILVSLYALGKFYKNTILESATNDLINNLQSLQSYANSNYIPDSTNLDNIWKPPFVYTFGFIGDINEQDYETKVLPYASLDSNSIPIFDINGRQFNLINEFAKLDLKSVKIEVFSDNFTGSYECQNCITFIGYQSRFIVQNNLVYKMCLRLSSRDEDLSTNALAKSRTIYINSKEQLIKEITGQESMYSCFDSHIPEDVPGWNT
ncbi:type II secretion system protein [bacterium]|nr:MAG: type II secretion system protein [bacterium]